MSHRGIFQLRRIKLFFCDMGGSSKGARSLLASPSLTNYIKQNPQIQFDFYLKRGKHPSMTPIYINGYAKDIPLRNKSDSQILDQFKRFQKEMGKRPLKHSGIRVKMATRSIQGEWTSRFSKIYPLHGLDEPPKEYIPQYSQTKPSIDRKKEHKRHVTDRYLRAKPVRFIEDI